VALGVPQTATALLVACALMIVTTPACESVPVSTERQERSVRDLEGISWPSTQALPRFARPRHLDVVDLVGVSGNKQMLFSTLQGVVNRKRPRIYLIQDPSDRTKRKSWLGPLNVPYTEHADPWALFERFADEIGGIVVYDPAIPDSINVATTIAGLRDAVVATPKVADTLERRFQLRVLVDLRGRFTDGMDAYSWQFEHLWPKTTRRMLIGLPPQTGGSSSAPFGKLRDYAVANAAMVVWLDATVPTERALFAEILGDMQPNTPYVGWLPSDVSGETSGVELLSENGIYLVPADWFENMTVFSGSCCREFSGSAIPPVPVLDNKVYVTFTFSDGDNLQFDQHAMRVRWRDGGRGSVPMNWTISPLLWDAAPAMLRYYLESATSNDLLVSGVSGAGYASPTPWPDATFQLFADQTGTYMEWSGLDVLHVLNWAGGQQVAMSPAEADAYIDGAGPLGIQLNWGAGTQTTILGGTTPQSTVLATAGVAQAEAAIDQATAGWDGNSPLFLSIGISAWEMTPSDIVEIAESLSSDYTVVRADQYFELIRQSAGL
jgi:GxGYxYP putative glycoside hydrolase C-terminal domain/GxGYxYP_N second domain/GxGYxYP third domain/GxGYxYP_N 1st domain